MAHSLGTPYKRGQSDIIKAYNRPTTDIEEGLAITETNVVTIKQFAGASEIPAGVMGGTELKGASAVITGLEVFVQLDDRVEAITANDSVYVTETGKFTNVSEGNTQVNAHFMADEAGTFIFDDGLVTIGANKRNNQKCAMISFAGGF